MSKILTVCKQGLVRSVGLADVLKMHFEPVDVIPVGANSNTQETLQMLCEWADHVIVMEGKYAKRLPSGFENKILLCDVGPDTYGNSHNRKLIDFVWQWTRKNQHKLAIKEHSKKI
jgi:predicted protein tyrosine phosphatase